MKVLSGSSTTKIAAKVSAITVRSTGPTYLAGPWVDAAGQSGGLGKHVLDRPAELAGRGRDVLVLRLHVDQLAVQVGQLHRDPLAGQLHLGERPVQRVLAEGVLPDS